MATADTDRFVMAEEPQVDADGADLYVPDGFKSRDEFINFAREEFTADASYDRHNRDAAIDDLRFLAMDQWDPVVRAAREAMGRPCLTINVLPQFIGQVIGDRRINETSIMVRPRQDATVEEAQARSGLIKSIEAFSRADRVYDMACEDQVACGIGNFRIVMDYAADDVFDQDLFIRPIPNPLAVVWDRMSVDPTGRDARHCFVQDTMPRKVYDSMFPEHPAPTSLNDGFASQQMAGGWFDQDVVRITEFWRMIDKPRKVAMYADGKVVDVTDKAPEEYEQFLFRDPKTGQPRIRDTQRSYAQMHLMTGFEILEGPYELPLTRLPIVKVTGREVRVGDDRVRFGLVRFAKDAQRMKNYWRSVAVEALALAPKSQWIGPASAFKGREEDFREAHISGDPVLQYNDNTPVPPTRVDPPPVPQALYIEANNNQQDIKDTTGLHDASLGVRSNEISGRAIQARQREGDVATVIYHDNLNASIQEGGDVINQLLGVCYDSTRTLRVIGPDNKHVLQKFNDPNDPDAIDITSGKYDVSLETGPSFTTQRQEAQDAMINAIQVAPQLMAVAGDLIVKAQDWPGAYEISERLKRAMPPEIVNDPNEPPNPAQQQAQQAAQQAQAEQQALQLTALQHEAAMAELQVEEAKAKVATAQANADKAEADARAAHANADAAEAEAVMAPVKHIQEVDHNERAAVDRSRQSAAQIERSKQQSQRPKGNSK